jgi:GNAT superfamily N-acetyltransferase
MPDFEVRIIADAFDLSFDAALAVYESVGWTVYSGDPEKLSAALRGSSFLAGAFAGPRLVGLLRAVSDDATICYVQDVLVHPDAQRCGVGRALMAAAGQRYAHVRQHVLLTDDEPGQRAFYESLGYAETRDHGDGTLRAFVRFGG